MNDYAINYEDERFKNVENEKQDRLNQINDAYTSMINQSDQFYQNQIDAAKEYATTQQDLQNQQTQLAIDEINQQKEKAQKDYLKEQRGAYSDWQKQSNKYGVEAERQAQNGLINSGYSESSQVSMYNTYQNRVSTARDSYNLAVQNYDNGIREARLANNSKLAEIAYQALQTELELSLNGFQYKNTLLLDQIGKQQDIDNTYYARWQNVLSQMNTENTLAEQIRQFNERQAEEIRQYNETMAENQRQYNEKMAYQKERDKVADAQWQKEFDLAKKATRTSKSSGSSGGSSKSKTSTATLNTKTTSSSSKNSVTSALASAASSLNSALSGTGSSSVTYKSKSTPILSSKAAQNWIDNLNKSIKGNNFRITEKDLVSKLNTAYKNGTLTDKDVSMVLKSFGAS